MATSWQWGGFGRWTCRVGGDLSLKLVDELKRIYDTYLESAVPPGDIPLK
jgi:hypothetical protein